MNRCKTCSHWESGEEYSTGYGLGLGRCKAAPMFWDSTQWCDSSNGGGRELRPEFANVKAFVQDASDYSAKLLTMPDFGCVSHSDAESDAK